MLLYGVSVALLYGVPVIGSSVFRFLCSVIRLWTHDVILFWSLSLQRAQLAGEKSVSGINGSQKVDLGVSAKIAVRSSQYE